MTNSTDSLNFSISGLGAALNTGRICAVDIAETVIRRVTESEHLGALAAFDPQWLLDQAAKSDARRRTGQIRPLEGIPLLLKDNIDTAHLPTTGGTSALIGAVALRNAPAAQHLSDAGAMLAAKATMHELAYGITSNNTVTGPVRNPYNPEMIAGGSSGGSASAVASGQFPAALGTDTGGSVRIPAALCGVFGFRPTVGRYPGDGVLPISHTRDTIGPIARSMHDIELLDQVLAARPRQSVPTTHRPCSTLRIGIPVAFGWQDLEAGVQTLGEESLRAMSAAGVTLVELDLTPVSTACDSINASLALYEMMHDLPQYLKARGIDITMQALIDGIGSPDVKVILSDAIGQGAISEASYLQARDVQRPLAQDQYRELFREHRIDAIAFPTTPLTARPIGDDNTVELNGTRVSTFKTYVRHTGLGSILGVPGISLPVGLADGLPVALELDGLASQDVNLLDVAHVINELLPEIPAPEQ